jgi:hypothetical protein
VSTPPKITAAALRDAAVRLFGTVVQFVEDATVGPALYVPRLQAWQTIDGAELLGEDDGTVIDLLAGVPARDLIAEHGTARAAAAAVNARLRKEWTA